MQIKPTFKNINTVLGWLMFAVASTVYIMTTEPTTPLWDCPEYTSTAVKLRSVPHRESAVPDDGTVITNMFEVDPSNVAFMMNVFACLASGVSIMLLFWITTYFTRCCRTEKWDDMSVPTATAVLGSGLVGSAAIMFSDTFWFNATESEVYSLANTFTVLVLYCAVRWADGFGRERNNKWLILIALLVGLAPGVHFMGMLGIPVVAMIYYFKTEEKINAKKFIIANIVAASILVMTFGVIFRS